MPSTDSDVRLNSDGMSRNQWPASTGTGGRHASESPAGIGRIMHTRTSEEYVKELQSSFQYQFVDRRGLTRSERRVFDHTPQILALIPGRRRDNLKVLISETIRITEDRTGGSWDPSIPAIVVRRDMLSSMQSYAGILLHELAHALSGLSDCTREFERVLTDYLGHAAASAVH